MLTANVSRDLVNRLANYVDHRRGFIFDMGLHERTPAINFFGAVVVCWTDDDYNFAKRKFSPQADVLYLGEVLFGRDWHTLYRAEYARYQEALTQHTQGVYSNDGKTGIHEIEVA